METPLKRFNTIYCEKLRKKSVSQCWKTKQANSSLFIKGVMDANCAPVTSPSRTERAFWESILKISGSFFQRCWKQRQCQRNNNPLWCVWRGLTSSEREAQPMACSQCRAMSLLGYPAPWPLQLLTPESDQRSSVSCGITLGLHCPTLTTY